MKEKWDKFLEFSKSRYGKPLLFFGLYFFFFLFIFMSMPHNTSTPTNNETKKNMWEDVSNNYEYHYDITLNNNQLVTLEGKRFNNKNIFTKSINGVLDSEIYTFYNDVSIKLDNKWTSTNSFVLVNNTFDNEYLDINYIKRVIADAELVNSTTNFDESKVDTYTFSDIILIVTSNNNILKQININSPLYKMTLQYKNINKVADFVVEK